MTGALLSMKLVCLIIVVNNQDSRPSEKVAQARAAYALARGWYVNSLLASRVRL
jgi:hypothetical protein